MISPRFFCHGFFSTLDNIIFRKSSKPQKVTITNNPQKIISEYESVTEILNDSQSCVVTMEHQTNSISDPRLVAKLKREKHTILPIQEALREAQNAFGIDFNFDEFYESFIDENYVDDTWIVKLKSPVNSTDLNDEEV